MDSADKDMLTKQVTYIAMNLGDVAESDLLAWIDDPDWDLVEPDDNGCDVFYSYGYLRGWADRQRTTVVALLAEHNIDVAAVAAEARG